MKKRLKGKLVCRGENVVIKPALQALRKDFFHREHARAFLVGLDVVQGKSLLVLNSTTLGRARVSMDGFVLKFDFE